MNWPSRKPISQQDAIDMVGRAVKDGTLANLKEVDIPCVDCGKRSEQYEHRDYNQPLDVVTVCRSCNLRRGPAKPVEREANLRFNERLRLLRQRLGYRKTEVSEERKNAMRRLFETGKYSLAEIGKMQTPPISRQRVHQILRQK